MLGVGGNEYSAREPLGQDWNKHRDPKYNDVQKHKVHHYYYHFGRQWEKEN